MPSFSKSVSSAFVMSIFIAVATGLEGPVDKTISEWKLPFSYLDVYQWLVKVSLTLLDFLGCALRLQCRAQRLLDRYITQNVSLGLGWWRWRFLFERDRPDDDRFLRRVGREVPAWRKRFSRIVLLKHGNRVSPCLAFLQTSSPVYPAMSQSYSNGRSGHARLLTKSRYC